jgi:hypothetical protein
MLSVRYMFCNEPNVCLDRQILRNGKHCKYFSQILEWVNAHQYNQTDLNHCVIIPLVQHNLYDEPIKINSVFVSICTFELQAHD